MKTAGKTKKKTESEVVKILGITEKTKWEDITIEFKNPYDVKIKSKGKSFDSDYEKMGFADKRKNTKLDTKTKASWDLLKLFSTTENQKFPLSKLDDKEKVKRKKQKQELSKLLKAFFQISDDPIMHNETANEYHMRIKLIPEETFRGQWADRNIFEENSP